MVGVGCHDGRNVPDDCKWSWCFDPGMWERHHVYVGEGCQDGLWKSSVKGRPLVTVTPNLRHVFPVPWVPLEEGNLQFRECISQWSSTAFEEELFISLGSQNPECWKILQLDWKWRRVPVVQKAQVGQLDPARWRSSSAQGPDSSLNWMIL